MKMSSFVWAFFFSLCFFNTKATFSITIEYGPKDLFIMTDGKVESYFDYNGQNVFSCKVPDVYHEKTIASQNWIKVINNDSQKSYSLGLKSLSSNKNVANPSFFNVGFPINISPQSSQTLNLQYNCDDLSNSDLFYTVIDLEFEIQETGEVLSFSYIKLCKDRDYIEYKFDYSLIIVVIIVSIFVIFSLRICRVMSLKKKSVTININYWKSFLYFVILIPLLILLNFYTTAFVIVYKVVVAIVAFFAFVFFSNQFLGNLLIRSNLYRMSYKIPKLNLDVTLFMLIGAVLGIAFIVPWGVTNNWVLGDIITLIIFIGAINVLKVNKFRNGLILMIIQIAADILWMILFNYLFNRDYSISQQYGDDKQYNDFFGSKLTIPLKIECMFITPEYNLNSKCSWIGISNLIIPCLLISYFNKYDNYVNATIYSIVSILAYLIGLVIWTIVQSKIDKIIPLSIYSYSLMCLTVAILAFKRNEHYEIWNGLFPDVAEEEILIKSHDLMEGSNEKKKSETERNEGKAWEGSPIPEGKSVSLSVKQGLIE